MAKKPNRKSKKVIAKRKAAVKKRQGGKQKEPAAFDPLAGPPPARLLEGIIGSLMANELAVERHGDPRLYQAQELIYQADDEPVAWKRTELARSALAICPDCAGAYVLLAEEASDLEAKLELYQQGVVAGERAIGATQFKEQEGMFWMILETRPYMRARQGVAECLWELGRGEEAEGHFWEMLKLNPNDNQGIRYLLAELLLDANSLDSLDSLERLFDTYRDDGSPEWDYGRALVAFRREGDSIEARKLLKKAYKTNPHVPLYLARLKQFPAEVPHYFSPGGEDQAACYCAEFMRAWRETPGAIGWLRVVLKLSNPEESRRRPTASWRKMRSAIANLPQCDDTWLVESRKVKFYQDDQVATRWLLVALNDIDMEVVSYELLDKAPASTQLASFLISALLNQQEPFRPAAIVMMRSSWFKSWQEKLAGIGVECRLGESMQRLDHWFEEFTTRIDRIAEAAEQRVPNHYDWKTIETLPRIRGEVWQLDVRPFPGPIDAEDGPLTASIGMVLDPVNQKVLAGVAEVKLAPEELLLQVLWNSLETPLVGEPHAPEMLELPRQYLNIVAPLVEPYGISCFEQDEFPEMDFLIAGMAQSVSEMDSNGSYLDSPDVDFDEIDRLFAAAADFYRARPWSKVASTVAYRFEGDVLKGVPRFANVMGQSGLELGLSLYKDLDFLRQLSTGEFNHNIDGIPMSAVALTFDDPELLDHRETAAAEQFGWKIAAVDAYPSVQCVEPGPTIRVPTADDLLMLEASLRAIPQIIKSGGERGEVTVQAGTRSATLTWERVDFG